jgi:uroporphyrin-III C-methyltransferase
MTGFVSLVGAGPGDPGLLTLRAVKRLKEADLILYDALVDEAALHFAPSRARRAFVGKRAGRHSIEQDTIERLMIRAALRGERVVRLKSGDPFVFGRGGEEALSLARAGVPFEVVPGVSAAVAAPALANIPVTHRGLSTSFVVVAGHAHEAYAPVLGALPPQSATVVVLMGLASRGAVAQLLLERGWPSDTPAAVILSASRDVQRDWRGALSELGGAPVDGDAPGVLAIGPTVGIAAQLETLLRQSEHLRTGGVR